MTRRARPRPTTPTTRRCSRSVAGRTSTTPRPAPGPRERADACSPTSATRARARPLVVGRRWLDDVLSAMPGRFDARHSSRWRDALPGGAAAGRRAARVHQRRRRPADGRAQQAERLRREAENQLELLRAETDSRSQSRLLQLPLLRQRGLPARLLFPRLPLSAFIPGRARPRRRRRVPPAPALPGDQRVRPAEPHLPRGRPLRDQPGDPPGRRRRAPTTATLVTAQRQALRARAATSTRSTASPDPTSASAAAPSCRRRSTNLFRLQNVVDASAATASPPTRRSASAGLRARSPASASPAATAQLSVDERRRSASTASRCSHARPTATPRRSGGSTSAGGAARTRTSSASCSTSNAATGATSRRRRGRRPRGPDVARARSG